jgi:hypothetical protein
VRVSDQQRRARLVVRHHLGRTASDVVDAVRSLVALHATDPATPHLSLRARVPGFTTGDLDQGLYEQRSLWRLHGMRRTLFIVAADEAPVIEAAAGRDVAARERRRLEGWLAAEMDPDGVPGWVAEVERRTLAVLADGRERRTQELTAAVPELATEVTLGSGKWATRSPISSRLLFLLAMDGAIVRTRPAGSWRSSQYHWATTASWFGSDAAPRQPAAARATLVRRYLAAHGPATLTDLRWWTGWTARHATAALADVGAVTVEFHHGSEGYVLPDDLDGLEDLDPGAAEAAVALLPALDPTPMGWKERSWYLGDHGECLYDRNGNAGPTVWVGGRVVGGWAQRPDGEVVHRLLEDVGAETSARVAAETGALTDWLSGVTVTPRFRTPLERELSG